MDIKIKGNGSPAATSFCKTFADVVVEDKHKTREWVDMLRKKDVKAAHPDDGWVDRNINEFHLQYPYFGRNRKIYVNDIIALGDYREYRLVRILAIREVYIGGFKLYKFTDRLSSPYDMNVNNLEECVEGTWFGC